MFKGEFVKLVIEKSCNLVDFICKSMVQG